MIFVVSMGLRWYHLGAQSLFSDEGVSWAVARLDPNYIVGMSEFDHHTPLYFFLLKLFLAIVPSTEAGVRTLSVLASATALICVLAYLRAEWSLAAAVYAGILMAFSSFDLYYAQETRMYTLLAAAWIISYISLANALQGKSGWLAPWTITMVAMPWTHLYGFLVVGANVAFVAGYLGVTRLRRLATSAKARWFLLSLALIMVGVLPMARVFLQYTDTSAMGAELTEVTALRDLYLIWSVGLVAVRQHFADSAHLTLPVTANLSPTAWVVIGTLVCGAPAVYGLSCALRMNSSRKAQAVLAIVNILLPVALAFGYSVAKGTQIWIQRPFLGAAYLVYLWAGIGLGNIRWRRFRWTLAVLAVIVALASLAPYFSTWQKSDARQALSSMPPIDEQNLLILQIPFLASLARFYLGPDAPIVAMTPDENGAPVVVNLRFDQGRSFARIMGRPQPVECSELASVSDVWLYGQRYQIELAIPNLPACVTGKRLWMFEEGHWRRLN